VGQASHYATAMCVDGYAVGLLVESHEGRPTKVEGNPDHPASLGAAGALEQASLIDLYGAQRVREIRRRGVVSTPDTLAAALRSVFAPQRRGEGVHVVMPPTSSEAHRSVLAELGMRMGASHVHFFTPQSRGNVWRGAQRAFGAVLEPRFDLRRAKVVLSVDSDFLMHGPARLALARRFAEARRVTAPNDEMNRLYVVEAALSVTGQAADHRLALRDTDLPRFVADLLVAVDTELGLSSSAIAGISTAVLRQANPVRGGFVRALARDLVAHRGSALVLVGDRQPAALHAAAHALNDLLNPVETPVAYAPSPILQAGTSTHDSLGELSAALAAGAVGALLSFDVNLLESTPGALAFDSLIRKAKTSFYFGTQQTAAADHCDWVAPLAHWLESWSDARAFDGTASIGQPLLEPLYAASTLDEVLTLALGGEAPSARGRVRQALAASFGDDLEAEWERSLRRGTVSGTSIAAVSRPALRWDWVAELIALATVAPVPLELSIYPDSRTLDGRFADNPWLVELPDPITKLTWQNAASLAPKTASRLGLENGDIAAISVGRVTREAPIIVVAGQAEDSIGLSLGWGRASGLSSRGVNACSLQDLERLWTGSANLRPTGRKAELPITQSHQRDEGFGEALFASSTLADYRRSPDFTKNQRKRQLSLYESDAPRARSQWGMAIDLNSCIGCASCVVACQAENNIPTVGAEGVMARREMHWLRIDRYVLPDATVINEPMACQHCEHAPCEYVCPTAATVHSSDGLNQMVYNRCVGTRFCSNNCPYKVRRFNWFNYHADEPPLHSLVHNPEVTVRARGVMEKCTYCVQRIENGKIRHKVKMA
ncbi:MAG TPA: 4Fe-4S dicluster domain-containing protein, partial [Polyangiaceae bacterium]|nr:4Fe-4S dicluster domain-containing protein [Polyangiaceae bacterium]